MEYDAVCVEHTSKSGNTTTFKYFVNGEFLQQSRVRYEYGVIIDYTSDGSGLWHMCFSNSFERAYQKASSERRYRQRKKCYEPVAAVHYKHVIK